MGVSISYVWGLVFLRLSGRDSYVWGLRILTFWGLVFLRSGVNYSYVLGVSSEGGMFLSGFSRGILINTRGHQLTPMTSPPIVLITHYRMTSYLSLVLPTGYELV